MPAGLVIAREALHIEDVDRNEVLRYLGYAGQGLSAEVEARIDEAVERCVALAQPVMALRSFAPVAGEPAEPVGEPAAPAPEPAAPAPASAPEPATAPAPIRLEGTQLELGGTSITEHLAGAEEVVLMAVTLGLPIDQELRRLSLTDSLAQVVFDAAATTLVERAADAAEARIRSYAGQSGRYASWRFSPGYGDLPLGVQPQLLASLDAARQLGITLTDSLLMVPTKSVSAVAGIHPSPQSGIVNTCANCQLRDFCTLRQQGRTCRG